MAKSATEVPGPFQKLNRHYKAVTSLALSPDGAEVYSGAKDGSIARWSVSKGKRKALRRKATKTNEGKGHRGAVLCMALSGDGKILVTGYLFKFFVSLNFRFFTLKAEQKDSFSSGNRRKSN